MPLNPNLDVTITPAQETAINDAIDVIITTLAAIGEVNLSAKERKDTPSVAAERVPYVGKGIKDLAPTYPAFVGLEVTQPRAERLFDLGIAFNLFKTKLREVDDRLVDLGINAEYITYRFMLDYYANGVRNAGRVAGADTIVEELAPLFEGQGNFGTPLP